MIAKIPFGRADRLLAALLLAGLWIAYATNRDAADVPGVVHGDGKYHPIVARGDGHMMFLITRSLVFDRDLSWDDDLRRFGDPWGQPTTKTGHRDIPHPIGPPLVWGTCLLPIHAVAAIANVFGAGIPTHGYTRFHQKTLFATSALFALFAGLCGVWLARRALSRDRDGVVDADDGPAWPTRFALIAILLGTSLTYYATFMPSYGHALDAAAVALFLVVWARGWGDDSTRRALVLGGLLGFASLIRTQNLFFGVVLASELVQRHRTAWRPILRVGGVALAAAIVGFLPQVIVWRVVYGEWFHYQNGPAYVRWSHPMTWELLFSSKNGWLSTTPLAYAGVIGLVLAPRDRRPLVWTLLGALLVQIYLNAVVYDWWASASFGQRRMCSVSAILVVGLACLFARLGAWRDRLSARIAAQPRVRLRAVTLTAAALVIGWFVWWNCAWIAPLRAGKAAGRDTGELPLKSLPPIMRNVAAPIVAAVGNPFAFPASAWFALRQGVPLTRWDRLAGRAWLQPSNLELNQRSYVGKVTKLGIGPDMVLEGLGPFVDELTPAKRRFRATTGARARVFVGSLLFDPTQLTWPLRSRCGDTTVTIAWNGTDVAAAAVGATEAPVVAEVPMRVGTNVLELRAATGCVIEAGDLALVVPR